MSTFDGIVEEFPYIQIDYFRRNPDRPPPLACFLSHVHSDHLQGLESFRAPFIYCSAATRELLLRIEKYPHRMNFNRGVLESRRLHYKHLYKLLRPIPLNMPTEIELTPRQSIRVTLLDANHCAGAVMFLIEGDGRAVLYTGDIRAEGWWVNSLIRHPILIPYTLGNKQLDKLYLDTTFASASNIYREFPSKAEGQAELLRKIDMYPDDTVFYFRAWTFGYEEVWMALSAALNAKVHVDRYQMGLYRSLSEHSRDSGSEGAALCGFELGNRFVPGCLSNDEKSRVHSCEQGTSCITIKSGKAVYIHPIINRMGDGIEILEPAAGGGGGDLYQTHELELPDQSALEELEKLCFERVRDTQSLSRIRQALFEAFRNNKTLSLNSYGMKGDYDVPLETLVSILSRGQSARPANGDESIPARIRPDKHLPNTIHFPYARHSSYTELRNLVSAFKPKDIYPCTVDPLTWAEDESMEYLFGDLCSDSLFSHDAYMRAFQEDNGLRSRKKARYDMEFSPQSTQQSGAIDGRQNAASFTDSSPSNFDNHPSNIEKSGDPAGRRPSEEKISAASSLGTTQDENNKPTQSTNSLQIPELTPTTETRKRSNICQAWHYLTTRPEATASTFHVGSLPSSFHTEETSMKNNHSQQHLHVSSQQNGPNNPTQTTTHSATDSSLESQEHDETLSSEYQDSSIDEAQFPSSAPSLSRNSRRPHLVRSSWSRLRREAYLAAKADSYDAWSSVSLLSAGNNHTEEEIEL